MKATCRTVNIPTPSGTCDAHLAAPEGPGRFPGVLFCMDAFGLRPVIDEWILRIASEGYVVLAPNTLYRGGASSAAPPVPKMLDAETRALLFERIRPLMQQLVGENAEQDAFAYLKFLSEIPEVTPGPVGVTGYCMGGALALRIAAAYPERVAAVASFHGGNLATDSPDSPHLLAPRIWAEVYVGHADQDAGAPPEQQERLAKAFKGRPFRAELYEGAPHGYTMSDTAAYREPAAERHVERLTDLLGRTLKAR